MENERASQKNKAGIITTYQANNNFGGLLQVKHNMETLIIFVGTLFFKLLG